MTTTATYPATADFAPYARLKTELGAADRREAAARITRTMADWAEETAAALRSGSPEPPEEHLDPHAWTDIATWLYLIAESLDGEMKAFKPVGRDWWLDVPEDEQEPWRDLAEAISRREWAAAWSVICPALDEPPMQKFVSEQVATMACIVIDAPW